MGCRSEAELTAMQCFLDRFYKRKYTSKSFSIKHLLEKQDRKVFRKVSGIDRHPLRQGFHLRPEAGPFVRSFAIPRPVL